MATVYMELLEWRLQEDAAVIFELADDQRVLYGRGMFAEVINVGDSQLPKFAHSPHALLLDAWSCRAEGRLNRQREVVLRLLRADCNYRKWECKVASLTRLGDEERLMVWHALSDYVKCLRWTQKRYSKHRYLEQLVKEYKLRLRTIRD